MLDARGCLTAAGLQAVRDAPPGRAPEDAARHLAGCARCQGRLLALGTPRVGASRAGQARTLARAGYVLLGLSVLAAVVLAALVLARR